MGLAQASADFGLEIALVTFQAMLLDGFWSGLGKAEDLGWIAARLHMRFARAVAAFAGNSLSIVLKG
jgi:hypothetical protein